jgi:hypothetical protein
MRENNVGVYVGSAMKRRGIYVYRGVCDRWRSFDKWAFMVDEHLKRDPLSGDVCEKRQS